MNKNIKYILFATLVAFGTPFVQAGKDLTPFRPFLPSSTTYFEHNDNNRSIYQQECTCTKCIGYLKSLMLIGRGDINQPVDSHIANKIRELLSPSKS